MARYLIEVAHALDKRTCLQTIEIFLKTGSHYLTRCDWGCRDGEHKAWLTVETDSKDEALRIVPPAFRAQARVVALDRFSLEQVQPALAEHTA
jgi:hypothetical protein